MNDYEVLENKTTQAGQARGNTRSMVPLALARTRNLPIRPPNLPKKIRPGKRGGSAKSWRDITAGDAAAYGYKAYEMAKQIVRLINVEEKIFDVDGTGGPTTITSTPTVINLSNIAQGTDWYQRVGDSIRPLTFRFAYNSLGSTATVGNMLRILVVQDKENQGVDPTMGDVLAGLGTPILAPPHPLYKQRFRILFDDVVAFVNYPDLATAGNATGYVPDRKRPVVVEGKLSGHILYDATAGADASNLEGAIFLMAASLDASNGPSIRYTFRLTFTDN